ncbi:helix-turn-helix domain-containing protein [Caproiciproducens sp.]
MIKLLVVDDYPLEGEVIEHILKKNRPEIQYLGQTLSAKQALSTIENSPPDIVLVDIKIPGMDGLHLSQILKETYPWMKIVIITAFDNFDYVQKSLRIGASDYFLKPLRSSDFLNLVDKLTGEIEAQTTLEESAKKSYVENIPPVFREMFDQIQLGNACESTRLINEIWCDMKSTCRQDVLTLGTRVIELSTALLYFSGGRKNCPEALYLAYHTFVDEMVAARSTDMIEQRLKSFVSMSVSIFNQYTLDVGYEQVNRAKELIEENLENHVAVSLDNIAHELYLSPFYLSRLFKKKTGINFVDYLIKRRLEMAKLLLLTTNETVETIAQETGYNEPSSFRRLFKKKIGISPSGYRLLHINSQEGVRKGPTI